MGWFENMGGWSTVGAGVGGFFFGPAGAAAGSQIGGMFGPNSKEEAAFDRANMLNHMRYLEGLSLHDEARTIGHEQLNYAGNVALGDIGSAHGGYENVINSIKGNYEPIIKQLRGGYNAAIGDVQNVGREAGRRINEAGAQSQAAGLANLQARGLGGTTIAPQFQMANQRDTQRSLMDLDERVATIRSGLRERGANAVSGVQQDRAGLLAGTRMQQQGAAINARENYLDLLKFRPVFEAGLAQDKAGFTERRTDMFNLPDYLKLLQSSGGGGGNGQLFGRIGEIFSGSNGGMFGGLFK